MNLTPGHKLVYAPAVATHPTLHVASTPSVLPSAEWFFEVEQLTVDDKDAVRVRAFADSCSAFVQIPEFFEALAETKPDNLEAVKGILEGVGAEPATQTG